MCIQITDGWSVTRELLRLVNNRWKQKYALMIGELIYEKKVSIFLWRYHRYSFRIKFGIISNEDTETQ